MRNLLLCAAIATMTVSPLAVMTTLPIREPAVLVVDPLLPAAEPDDVQPYGRAASLLQKAQYGLADREKELAAAEDCLSSLQEPSTQGLPCPDGGLPRALQRVKEARAAVASAQAAILEVESAIETTRSGARPQGRLVEQNTVLILFSEDSTEEQRQDVLRRHGLVERSRLSSISLYVATVVDDLEFRTPEGSATRLRAIVGRLKEEGGVVRTAAQNVLLGGTIVPGENKPTPRDWFADNPRDPLVISGFPAAWNVNDALSHRDAHVTVGVLDIGFTVHKPNDLDITSLCSPEAKNVHGTKVASIIGARFNDGNGIDGATTFARLQGCAPLRVLTLADFENSTHTVEVTTARILFDEYLKGLDVLLASGVQLINTSISYKWGPASAQPEVQAIVESHGEMVRRALVPHEEVLVVSAAGNDGRSFDAMWANPFNWAALGPETTSERSENVIVVEGLDATGENPFASSNRGGHIAAVAVNVPSIASVRKNADNTIEDLFGPCTGTSCSTPLVTAAVAQMLAATPSLTPPDIKKHLGIGPVGSASVSLNVIAALMASSPTFEKDAADIDVDGDVDLDDFDALNDDFKLPQSDHFFSRSDFNGDHVVDRDDLAIMLRAWTGTPEDAQKLPEELGK